jgi:hypothetical protein
MGNPQGNDIHEGGPMAASFTCDNCGRDFPRDQLKEVIRSEGDTKVKENLCPECLDQKMNEAPDVYGVPGNEKRRAAFLADEGEVPEGATGKRE